jgi:chromosome partitioning protein
MTGTGTGRPRVLAVTNQKGGVGKTTTVANLGAALADGGRRVLLVDLDPQCSLTLSWGLRPSELARTACEVLADPEADVADALVALDGPGGGLDLLPASRRLGDLEPRLAQATAKEVYLREALGPVKGDYGVILIDTPPNLGVLTINALAAADAALVPLQPEFLPLQGLGDLKATVELLRRYRVNPTLEIAGVVATMASRRFLLEREVLEAAEALGVPMCATRIPRSVRFAEAPAHGCPLVRWLPDHPGAWAYRRLAEEVSGVRAAA